MLILGFNCYVFDSAACILRDGKLIAAAQEERFCRRKGTGEFPKNAIQFCLDEAGVTIDDLDHVGFYWQPYHGFHKRIAQLISVIPYSLNFWGSHYSKWTSLVRAEGELRKQFPSARLSKSRFEFHRVRHHLAHAAGSFFVSPYEKAAIMVFDGSGEIHSTSLLMGEGNRIQTLKSVQFPHSMGYVYVALTHYLGFKPDSDEYKVMALASMGEESQFYETFKKIVRLESEGRFSLDLRYFNFHKGIRDPWVSKRFIREFGPLRIPNSSIETRQQNIAWALQRRLEDVVLHSADYLYRETQAEALVLSGGCMLNSVMNERLYNDSKFTNVWTVPAPNDAGTSIGAAMWVHNCIHNRPRNSIFDSAYLGPQFSESEIENILEIHRLPIQKLDQETLLQQTAKDLAEGKVIGWFQGRAEFGPRALGNRSILADPRSEEMKGILNAKIKHRESFRPFAPAILEHRAKDYFVKARRLPFMLFVLPVRTEKRLEIPAVIHEDGTARVQTVTAEDNPLFYGLIEEFSRLTGVPALLNTSFNDAGEPIVNSPEDAIKSFQRTNLDLLVLGSYLIYREDL